MWTTNENGIAIPQTPSEWAAFIAHHGLDIDVPTSTWNPANSTDETAGSFSLNASGVTVYQHHVTGWKP